MPVNKAALASLTARAAANQLCHASCPLVMSHCLSTSPFVSLQVERKNKEAGRLCERARRCASVQAPNSGKQLAALLITSCS